MMVRGAALKTVVYFVERLLCGDELSCNGADLAGSIYARVARDSGVDRIGAFRATSATGKTQVRSPAALLPGHDNQPGDSLGNWQLADLPVSSSLVRFNI